jgi:hypothetical protein
MLKNIRENKHVEKPACVYAEERGWMQRKVGDDGWPDRVFIRKGRTVWWEFKIPAGGILSPKQTQRIKELNEHGAEVHHGGDLERFKRIMR